MRSRMVRCIALGLTLACLLAGCGGSVVPPTATRTSPTQGSAPSGTPAPISTPAPLPGDIPVYPGAHLLVAQDISTGTLYFYQAVDSPAPVIQFYLAQMPKNGWQQQTAEPNGPEGMYLVYTKEDQSITMNIVPDQARGSDTDISIILANR